MYSDLEAALRMPRETEARLTLQQVRVVALPSRIRIIRALAQKRSTVTEISRRTGIAKSTALKHLRVLKRHGLVVRHEEERLWVYYDLTPAGRAVGKLDPLKIVVIFCFVVGTALLASAAGARWWGTHARASEEPWAMPPLGVDPLEPTARGAFYALAAGGAALVALGAWLWHRARLPPEDEAPTDTSSSP